MKIPLADQITEAEQHRDELLAAVTKRPELSDRLDRSEGIVLTLRLIATVDAEFRQFMKSRKDAA